MTTDIEIVTVEGGKGNCVDADAIAALGEAFTRAAAAPETGAILLRGREGGPFCAGLDNAVLARGEAAAADMLSAMGRLLLTIFESPVPVVAQVEGHAVAAGAMLLLVSDIRIGAPGAYRIGFSEVGIGMPLPGLPIALARHRLDPRWLTRTTALGELLGPDDACAAGFLDRLADAPQAAAIEAATALAAIDRAAYAETVRTLRKPVIAEMKAAMA